MKGQTRHTSKAQRSAPGATAALLLLLGASTAAAAPSLSMIEAPLPPGASTRLGTTRLRHAGRVTAVAFSPDGLSVASSGEDGTVRLWQVATGKEQQRFVGGAPEVRTLAFSPDGTLLVSASGTQLLWRSDGSHQPGPDHNTLRVWEVTSGRLVRVLPGTEAPVAALAVGARSVVGCSPYSTLMVWDLELGTLRHRVPANRGQHGCAVALSPDGKVMASGVEKGMVGLWDVASGQVLRRLKGHGDDVRSVAFAPDGKTLASGGSRDGSREDVRIWDVVTGKQRASFPAEDNVSLAFTADGARLVSGGQPVKIWDTATRRIVRRHVLRGGEQNAAISPNGQLLASMDGHRVMLWDAVTGKARDDVGHARAVKSLDFSADGTRLVSATEEGWAVWNLRTASEPARFEKPSRGLSQIKFLPDGQRLLATDGNCFIADARTGKRRVFGGPAYLWGFALSRDGAHMLTTDWHKGTATVWDVATGTARLRFKPSDQGTQALAISPDGTRLATASGWYADPAIRLWDARGKLLTALRGHSQGTTALEFSPDGKTLASVGDEGRGDGSWVRLHDVRGDNEPRVLAKEDNFQPRPGHAAKRTLAFAPDGRTLAVTGRGGVIRLFDVAEGAELRALHSDQGDVYRVAFSRDGTTLASAGANTTVLLWEVGLPGSTVKQD